jgi:hypothetical protein
LGTARFAAFIITSHLPFKTKRKGNYQEAFDLWIFTVFFEVALIGSKARAME